MLQLDTTIPITKEVGESPNLTDRFSEFDLRRLGVWVWEGYNRDQQSRRDWLRRNAAGMDLAMQVVREKTFPWQGCSNIAFPLVTIATLQFHSRAYPALVPGTDLVRYRVIGEDPDHSESDRAQRIATHMSYQLLEEDSDWEEQHDRALINLAIVGTVFKKTYYCGEERHNESELVLARDLVADYWAKSVETARRKTHVIPVYRNEIYSKAKSGIYRDVLEERWYAMLALPAGTPDYDKRSGTRPAVADESTPFTVLEQHCWIDLDCDGYAEPYIITIEESSKEVLRIVTRFDSLDAVERNIHGEVISIRANEHFTKYGFIPSPDGGLYEMGFGVFLGPLNESVNSIINQLVDSGTLSNTAGGFLGRGAKLRGGEYKFSPFGWNRVDASGDDLNKSIVPLPVREPSMVLFQLLSLLIDYTNRISGSTEMQMGENPGQNTPAQTAQTMVEQGQKIYAAIYKRVWRSMKEEYKKLYLLNALHMPDRAPIPSGTALREDYLGDPKKIVPAADPHVVSEVMRVQQAMALKQAAMSTPGYNLVAVEQNFLRAMRIDGWQTFYPGPDKVPPLPNFKMQVEQIRAQVKGAQLQFAQQKFALELQEQHQLNLAKITQLEAQAAKLLAEAGGVQAGHEIAAFNAAIGAMKQHNDAIAQQVDLLLKGMEHDRQALAGPSSDGGGVSGMAGGPQQQGALPSPAGMAGGL